MISQAELHNNIAGDIIKSIVKPPIEAGGTYQDVFILLETVVIGVVLFTVKHGGDEQVLDAFMANVKGRLGEIRLSKMTPGGSA